MGSVNFICSNEGINIIDWENYSLNGKQKDEIEMVITNFADLYHKVYGKKCCDDNNHTKIKKILREHY